MWMTKNHMVAVARCIFQRGRHVSVLEERVVFENLSACRTGRQEVQHIAHADAKTAQTRPATAPIKIGGNAMKFAHLH